MARFDMTRFDITEWSDFVRGLTSPEKEAKMRRALERSAAARRQVAALRQVEELARTEAESAPPEWAVRCAKAIGSLRRPAAARDEEPSLIERIAMHLSFDSLTSPAPVGTRDLQAHDRQLVFEAGTFRVDLRLEPEADLQTSVLVGQLLRAADPGSSPADTMLEGMEDIPVFAMTGDELVARARTGEYGEFQAEGVPSAGLDLFFLVDDESCLELAVGNAHEAHQSGGLS